MGVSPAIAWEGDQALQGNDASLGQPDFTAGHQETKREAKWEINIQRKEDPQVWFLRSSPCGDLQALSLSLTSLGRQKAHW